MVIPCYREGDLLEEAVASVERQTYPSWEIVVCNDASPDRRTNQICRELQRSGRASVVYNSRNMRTAAARNHAIRASHGELLFPLDGDDMMEEGLLSSLVSILLGDRALGFVYPDCIYLNRRRTRRWNRPEFDPGSMIGGGYAGCGILFWREVYEQTDGYREDLWGQEDWDFQIQLCGVGAVGKRVEGPAYVYRIKAKKDSKHVQARLERGKETLEKILRYNEPIFTAHSRAVIEALSEKNRVLWEAVQRCHSVKWQLKQLAGCIVNPLRACVRRVRGPGTSERPGNVVQAE